MFSGLEGIVVRQLREKMVAYVGIGNVVQNGVDDVAVSAVLCRQLTAQPIPLIVSVVREVLVGVVQLGDQHEPEVYVQIGDNVQLEDGQ